MNVLVLGSGGREHALCHSISNSPKCDNLYCIPGNPGIQGIAKCVDLNPLDNDRIKDFVEFYSIDLIIPGSEVYLENGIVDAFSNSSTRVFGPNKKATQIESSKEFAKDLMKKYNIPTAKYETFDNFNKAKQYVLENDIPIVIKYDGLAGGKGVVVATSEKEALEALKTMLIDKKYGNSKVIIEEFLEGPEFSLMCFVNKTQIIPMPIAQDHKRLLDNDLGPNTGGMGIYSPVPIISDQVVKRTMTEIMVPIVNAMISEQAPFTGFLYGGMMLTSDGPKVIEFNARFGDPEAEVILPKLESDILEIITNLFDDKQIDVIWNDRFYVGVVLASKGYPNSYTKNHLIEGLEDISDLTFHMGTKLEEMNLVSNGGRVLLITGNGITLEEAISNAYNNINKIKCDNLIYRKDIGKKDKRG